VRDTGPAGNGWTPQEPLVERAKLSDVVDAVLNYHPDAARGAGPIGGPIASSTTARLTSANAATMSGNSSALTGTTNATESAQDDYPVAHPIATSTASALTSVNPQIGAPNDGAHTGTIASVASPLASHLGPSTAGTSTSINNQIGSTNDGVPRDTTYQPHTAQLGGLGRFRRTKSLAAHTTGPGRQSGTTTAARRPRHQRTPAGFIPDEGSNKHHLAVAEGFEPPDGFSRLSLSRRVH
jgi:hypothetical protein